MEMPQESTAHVRALSPDQVLEKRKQALEDSISALSARVNTELMKYYNGNNKVSVIKSDFDDLVVKLVSAEFVQSGWEVTFNQRSGYLDFTRATERP